jgi:hypothetical protein
VRLFKFTFLNVTFSVSLLKIANSLTSFPDLFSVVLLTITNSLQTLEVYTVFFSPWDQITLKRKHFLSCSLLYPTSTIVSGMRKVSNACVKQVNEWIWMVKKWDEAL